MSRPALIRLREDLDFSAITLRQQHSQRFLRILAHPLCRAKDEMCK
jgi:predicted chitinase